MKRIFFALLFCLIVFSFKSTAQNAPVPENYVLKESRKPANAFVVNWIPGSPDVTVTLGSALIKYTDKNPELLVIYLGNYAKYAIQHKADFNKTQADLAAVKALIDKYNKETTHKRDKGIEKLAQIDQDGKLEDWIKSDLEK